MSIARNDSEKAYRYSQEPQVRLGGTWLPLHLVLEKMETAATVINVIEQFNTEFAHLATADTRDVVPCVRRRLEDTEQRIPDARGQGPLAEYAADLLTTLSPEQVIETLATDKGVLINQDLLIQLAGEEPYHEALQRDAVELDSHSVSAEQAARLWDDLGRPAPNGRSWRASDIEELRATPTYEAI